MGYGIYAANFLKDLLCLPRPQSPPVVKLSSSHHVEYGFPSSHTVNSANLVPIFLRTFVPPIHLLSQPFFTLFYYVATSAEPVPPVKLFLLTLFATLFAGSICFSRVYCGMHSVIDVVGGLALGMLILIPFCVYMADIDNFMHAYPNCTRSSS